LKVNVVKKLKQSISVFALRLCWLLDLILRFLLLIVILILRCSIPFGLIALD
jgi:hypothetical protein